MLFFLIVLGLQLIYVEGKIIIHFLNYLLMGFFWCLLNRLKMNMVMLNGHMGLVELCMCSGLHLLLLLLIPLFLGSCASKKMHQTQL